MNNQLEELIRAYLPDVIHMSIATVADNTPWVSEVHYAYDDDLNLYFISRPSRRHSVEAAANNKISGNIVKQHGKGEPVRGVYFEGTIVRLENVTNDDVPFVVYNQRFDADASILEEQHQENGHVFYKITVKTFYVFDELALQPAGKHELPWN